MTTLAALQPCEAARSLTDRANQHCLSDEAFMRARDFILEFGTNLQRERLLYHFADTNEPRSYQNVLAALKHYQNDDGGFGHGLEADLRTKSSTVIATTVGLQILESIGAMNTDIADDAIQFLMANYEEGSWHNIHAKANDAPHAPWWKYEVPGPGFCANPSAEVLRYLLQKRVMVGETETLIETAVNYIHEQPLEMHELLCYVRLYECPTLPKPVRLAILPHLLSNGYRLVNIAPKDWEEYCLTPLTVVTHSKSVFAEFFADVIEDNIQFLIRRQQDDGAWLPNWSWAGEFPATWRTVETEIKAELTLKNLMQLASFNRICAA